MKGSPITEAVFNQVRCRRILYSHFIDAAKERDRILGFEGGKAVLISGCTLDTDSNDIRRALLGWNIVNISFVKECAVSPHRTCALSLTSGQ